MTSLFTSLNEVKAFNYQLVIGQYTLAFSQLNLIACHGGWLCKSTNVIFK